MKSINGSTREKYLNEFYRSGEKGTEDSKLERVSRNSFAYCGSKEISDNTEKRYDLTIIGLIHGNEVNSIRIINRLMQLILNKSISPKINICFCLANIQAYLENKRFIDKDLNRIFNSRDLYRPDNSNYPVECDLLVDLETILKRSKYVLDLHQTQGDTCSPFLISGHSKDHLIFAQTIQGNDYERFPLITFKEKPFYNNDVTLNEFSRMNKTVALTVELGKKGFNTDQLKLGQELCLKAINFLDIQEQVYLEINRPIYSLHDVIYSSKSIQLRPDIINMSYVTTAESITDGEFKIYPSSNGRILFPKRPPLKVNDKRYNLGFLIKEEVLSSFLKQ